MKRALLLVALFACKKDDAAKPAPASASASGTASASAAAPKKPPPAAMAGFATIAKSEQHAATGMAGGASGGIGDTLGNLLGGGRAAKADPPAPQPPSTDKPLAEPAGDDAPPDEDDSGYNLAKIVFPPAGAKGGDCGAVADRIMLMIAAVIEDQIAQLPPDQQKMAKEMAGKEMHGSLVQSCTDQQWSQDLRDCVLTAMDKDALQGCEKLQPKEGPPAESPDSVATPKPAPAWSGGNACADVGARMKQLAEVQIGDVPADQAGQVDAQLDAQVKDVVDACTQDAWTEAERTCVVQATTLDAAGACLSG